VLIASGGRPIWGKAKEDAPMPSNSKQAITLDLEGVRERIDRWRQGRAAGKPMPAELWEAAADVAREQGVSRTARALGLDYQNLKSRAQVGKPVETARFVEWTPPEPAAVCRIEIESANGTRIKMELPSVAGAQVALALCATVGGMAR
jgi:hypothetical protein